MNTQGGADSAALSIVPLFQYSKGLAAMFELSVRDHFSAAHFLRGYQGKCATRHGHNWEVDVRVRGKRLNAAGMLTDFREIKDALNRVLKDLDHRDLNETGAFRKLNPTCENLARHLFTRLSKELNDRRLKVFRVDVRETASSGVGYWERD